MPSRRGPSRRGGGRRPSRATDPCPLLRLPAASPPSDGPRSTSSSSPPRATSGRPLRRGHAWRAISSVLPRPPAARVGERAQQREYPGANLCACVCPSVGIEP
eukprot:scaffold401_cov399-Prasinococcus_capsulatus_cf.AAC.15